MFAEPQETLLSHRDLEINLKTKTAKKMTRISSVSTPVDILPMI